ncbi:hypothetical protein CC2G_003733 [Coprinopsis cinerea AmutBmut pab1-1]|nr:hypothetical protein CC2G_003733 [Coprinopsis cinerea AmutBmut pab1-1]
MPSRASGSTMYQEDSPRSAAGRSGHARARLLATPPSPPPILPIHEFPEVPTFIREWCDVYLGAVLGQTMLKRTPAVADIHSRMRNLYVSRVEWRRCLAGCHSSLDEDGVGVGGVGVCEGLADGGTAGGWEREHWHHYLVVEVSLKGEEEQGRKGAGAGVARCTTSQVQGHLRIEGTCRPHLVFDHNDPLGRVSPTQSPPSPSATSTDSFRITSNYDSNENFLDFSSFNIEDEDVESTPVPARRRFSGSDDGHGEGVNSKPKAQGDTSPLFISPFASRTNSSTSTVATERTSSSPSSNSPSRSNSHTKSRSNSNSNSDSNRNSSTHSSSSSFGSLMGKRGSSGGGEGGPSSAMADRLVVSTIEHGRPLYGLPGSLEDQHVRTLFHDHDDRVGEAGASDDRPALTLRDWALLVDVVESSVQVGELGLVHQPPSLSGDDGNGLNGGSEEGVQVGLDERACCCRVFRRLLAVVPSVSSLEPAQRGGIGDAVSDPSCPEEHMQGREKIQEGIRARFEQRKRKFDRELRLISGHKSINRRV